MNMRHSLLIGPAALMVGVACLSTQSVKADPFNITLSYPLSSSSTLLGPDGSLSKNTTLGNFGDPTVYSWLYDDVTTYNEIFNMDLCLPVTPVLYGSTPTLVSGTSRSYTVDVPLGYDYVVFHYGSPLGGEIQAFYLNGVFGPTVFNEPTAANNAAWSASDFYKCAPVPDTSATLLLLGAALLLVFLIPRRRAYT